LSPIRYRPRRDVPLYTAVGGDESDEFKRQNRLIATCWEHCFRRDILMPGCHHLGVVEQLGNRESALVAGALEMMGLG
jgi:arylformamidase